MTESLRPWELDGNPDDLSLRDNVSGLSFRDEGALWVASSDHGIGRLDTPTGAFTPVALPNGLEKAASSLACDPVDGSVWVGFARVESGRWKGSARGARSSVPLNTPQFTKNPLSSIQIDRWSTPWTVYFAHRESAERGQVA